MKRFSQKQFLLPALLFVLVFGLYASTTPNSNPNFADSDELIAAAKVMGVPHPPGYPLFVLLSALFARIPLFYWTFAGKINLLNSLFESLAVVFFYLASIKLLSQFSKDKFVVFLSSFLSALLLAFANAFWFYGILTEVFPLHHFLSATVIYLLFKWHFDANRRKKILKRKKLLFAIAFIAGLGISNQQTFLLMAPFALLLVFKNYLFLFKDIRTLIAAGAMFTIGFLLPYIYVPLAASRNPYINWENATTPQALYRLIARRIYADVSPEKSSYIYFHQIRADQFANQIVDYGKYLQENFGHFGIVLGLIGLVFLSRKKRYFLTLAVLSGIIFTGLFFSLYDPINWGRRNADDFVMSVLLMRRFYTLSLVFFAFLSSIGLYWIFATLKNWNTKIFGLAGMTIGLIVAVTGAESFFHVSNNDFTIANAYSKAIYSLPKKDSIVFCFTAEWGCFSGYYLQTVENFRQDILIVPGDFNQRTSTQLKQTVPDLMQTTSNSQIAKIRDIIRWQIDKRPLYVMSLNTYSQWQSILNVDGNPYYLIPQGCGLYQISTTFTLPENIKSCSGLEEKILLSYDSPLNYYKQIYQAFFAYQHYFNATTYQSHQCFNEAKSELEQALYLYPPYDKAATRFNELAKINLADNCPKDTEAIKLEDVIAKYQEYYSNWQKDNDSATLDKAIGYAFTASMIEPKDVNLRMQLANLQIEGRYFTTARVELQDILVLDPNNQEARQKLKAISL